MRNLSVEEGLVKNARVIVVHLARRYVKIKLLKPSINTTFREDITSSENLTESGDPRSRTGSNSTEHCIPQITFEFRPPFAPWTVNRQQIPLRLAYSTTFNSCQGLTLDRCVLDLRTPVFAHGQLYTSISRVRRRDDIRAMFSEVNETHQTTNVVYPELLL